MSAAPISPLAGKLKELSDPNFRPGDDQAGRTRPSGTNQSLRIDTLLSNNSPRKITKCLVISNDRFSSKALYYETLYQKIGQSFFKSTHF